MDTRTDDGISPYLTLSREEWAALRNDTPMTAYQTPVDSQRLDLTLAGLAICPEADKDNYAVTISAANAMKAIEVVVSWDDGQPLSMSILNAGGTSIGNGTANGDGMHGE